MGGPIYGKYFAAAYDEKWGSWGPKMWPFLRNAVRRLHPGASTWLDLCCGAGSLLKIVCRQGFSAVGLDGSRHQLRHARRNVPGARLLCCDVRELSLPQRFDVITCMYDSLNYLRSKRELGRVFRRVHGHLSPNGLFAFDMNTFEGLQDRWRRTSTLRGSRSTIIIDTSFSERSSLGRCRITGFLKEGRHYRKFEEVHLERGYRAREIEELLSGAGFSFQKCDGDDFSRPRKRSGRLLYVCRKESTSRSGRRGAGAGGAIKN